METCWKPLGIVTFVAWADFPFQGNPYVVSTRFPHLETANPRIPPRFPALETWGQTQLTSGFYEFPHLETVNSKIPLRFFALETSEKPHRKFPRVTSFHTRKQLDLGFHLYQLHGKLVEIYLTAVIFKRFRDILHFVNFLNFIICNENAIWTLKNITLPYLDV